MMNEKIEYFEKAESKDQAEFLKAQNHCVLCDSVLELQHGFHPDTNEVQEMARCPQCQIRNRSRRHKLQ